MIFNEAEICNLVEMIWYSILGVSVQRDPQLDGDPEEARFLTGAVELAGAWAGTITLDCPYTLARYFSACMFAKDPATASPEDVHDGLGELANMVAGSLKPLVPGPTFLGLPTVTDGGEYHLQMLDAKPMVQTAFRCLGLPFQVTILERLLPTTSELGLRNRSACSTET